MELKGGMYEQLKKNIEYGYEPTEIERLEKIKINIKERLAERLKRERLIEKDKLDRERLERERLEEKDRLDRLDRDKLDRENKNFRHLDTNLFKIAKSNKVFLYNNTSRFEDLKKKNTNKDNIKYILCLGYINHIKNQAALIEIAKKTKELDVVYKIIYNYFDKKYFNSLNIKIKKAGLKNIIILHEKDTSIFEEISNCWLLINVSITEVMPLSLIEGNCMSKTFLSYDVGSVDRLTGIINQSSEQMIFNIKSLYHNTFLKEKLENLSSNRYKAYYSNNKLLESFSKFNEIIK